MVKHLKSQLKKRREKHNKVIDQIKDFPVFDEIINFFSKNMKKFNAHTTIKNIMNIGGRTGGMYMSKMMVDSYIGRSKILQKTQHMATMGASTLQ